MNPNLARLSEKARNLTHDPGVYLMKNDQGEIILAECIPFCKENES